MSGLDTFILAMALTQVIFVGLLVWMALHMLDTLKQGQKRVQPAVDEAKAVAEMGKAVATHAREEGAAVVLRVKAVAEKVKQRVATTRRIVGELKPAARETASEVGEKREELAQAAHAVSEKARTVRDIAQRLGRVKSAAESAAGAARNA
ncbi:MAG TPA: hypothetical protein VK689_00855 [Armatimonadota bacterium]|nr:hypothetical protein [Armatimonadota bacterium]